MKPPLDPLPPGHQSLSALVTKGTLPEEPYCGIACTGHRHLDAPSAVAKTLRQQIAHLAARASGARFVGISSIASGADTLFTEAILSAGIPWVAVLPMPRIEFRQDFKPEPWRRAAACLAEATAVIEPTWETLLTPEERVLAYAWAGRQMVALARFLVGVWDGAGPRGPGGTAEIIGYARTLHRPLLWICSATGGIKRDEWTTAPDSELWTVR